VYKPHEVLKALQNYRETPFQTIAAILPGVNRHATWKESSMTTLGHWSMNTLNSSFANLNLSEAIY